MGIYKVWQGRIESRVFTKAQCNQFAAAVVALAEDRPVHGKQTNLTREEAIVLVNMIRMQGGVRLADTHEQQGRDWLRSRAARKALPSDFPFEDVENLFSHFTYNGFAQGTRPGRPIWRIHLTDGRMIDYYNSSWQSGAYGGEPDGAWQYVTRAQEMAEKVSA